MRRLSEIYFTWKQRGQAHMPISHDDLALLTSSSRLIHAVASPLLFHGSWRQMVLGTDAAVPNPAVTKLVKTVSSSSNL